MRVGNRGEVSARALHEEEEREEGWRSRKRQRREREVKRAGGQRSRTEREKRWKPRLRERWRSEIEERVAEEGCQWDRCYSNKDKYNIKRVLVLKCAI